MQKDRTTHLIIGAGEIGNSLFNVLKKHYKVAIRDIDSEIPGPFDVLHICYPPIKNFISASKAYIKQYNPKITIIHSTVPVGTTKHVHENAVHSPVRGTHPNLEKGIKEFVKYFGGKKSKLAARIFSKIGVKVKIFEKSETTELAKILDTTYYGWNIVFCKEAKAICDKLDLNFDDVYTFPNLDYNKGYAELGKKNVIRPVLKPNPGKIGGHCVVPNCDLLNSWLTNTVKQRNKTY